MAPSFSTKNLLKQLPVLQSKLNDLYQATRRHNHRYRSFAPAVNAAVLLPQVLDGFAAAGRAVDAAELMVTLSVDFILASMFGIDCHTLEAPHPPPHPPPSSLLPPPPNP